VNGRLCKVSVNLWDIWYGCHYVHQHENSNQLISLFILFICGNSFPSPIRMDKIIHSVKRITTHSVCKSQQIEFAVDCFTSVVSDRKIKGCSHQVGLINNKPVCPQLYCIANYCRILVFHVKIS
jgi:hypothetical protein